MKTEVPSIEVAGFLSPEIENYRSNFRVKYALLLADCERASAVATTRLHAVRSVARDKATPVAIALWARCITACQSSILLAERGLGLEAQILLRSALENLFLSVALVKQPDVLDKMIAKQNKEMQKQAKAISQHKDNFDALNPENQANVQSFIESASTIDGDISAHGAAEIANLEFLYHASYRTLSLIAAHPSLATAAQSFGESPFDLRFGPSDAHLDEVFKLARECLSIGDTEMAPVLG
ncbi:hypothetical protein E2553_38270 [Paraburkholderia dipogonis]|uniref:Uncharacterized protein n=1 Tax=Paraburkholderia dipogonis TaxID=1211383 RepID=A0A4Y8MIT2_9BURK|nr:DUF5677 domain-containing protein [Paraburkholderia dipogonis]TFE37341.1 hypothetical protein E2553_38270 [Paraburkholderia dipogonis]